ncbi:MAG: hypothetical protein MUP85_19045 [Candidatus Lokiarchaeota archaeon]|nr:hypothetical protein [Candidatus Lokiarchaeota archaeon]
MIVIFVDDIENFLQFINKRVMNEIFYEFSKIKSQTDLLTENTIEIILHFLAKIENNLILYETKQTIVQTKNSDIDTEKQVFGLQKIISQVDESLVLVKGKIREIFLSYSS